MFSLWRKARRENSAASRLLGTTSLRFALHGWQRGNKHNAICCDNTRTVETVHASPVSQCETCGEDLSKMPCQGVERRTRIDIIFEKVVTHVDAEIKQCPQCRTRNKGP
ncbi:hypothetical protein, partial [Thiolapillus sp.]|uniref:hypothetical protein n=1 Tax=Thiolapillus sp. TaxID=2017437 RepID=UPI003AF51013